MSSEIISLLLTVAIFFVFGIPAITRKQSLPRDLEFEQVPPEALTPEQSKFFAAYDTELGRLGYAPAFTYRVTNLIGRNLLRTYANSNDTARCTVTMLTAGKTISQQTYVEFITQYSDGAYFSTRNTNLSSIFKQRPNCIVQECRRITSAAELKRRHDAKAQEFLAHGPTFFNRERFFADFRNEHIRICEYQRAKRLLRWEPATNRYRLTRLCAANGIVNFLNPLADNFTPLRFAVAAILGAGLPSLVMLEPLRTSLWLSAHSGLSVSLASLTLLLGSYVIGGVAIGLIFRQKTFIWAFLLGYLPSLLLANHGMFAMSMVMAFSADIAFRVHSRARKLI